MTDDALTGDSDEAMRAIEALVMVADEPVEAQLLAQLLELPIGRIEEICAALAAGYAEQHRGFELVRVAGGYQYRSHPDQAVYVERFVLHGRSARLSAAALETLAIVAYKQPVSRAQVAAIRGVNVDGVIRTLERRGYIAEIARDPGPGQAVLYGTTKLFLSKLGIDSTDDLPSLAGFIPDADIVEALETGLRVRDDPGDPTPDAGESSGDVDDA
ncbi:MAG: SMC-Scp complex subunit ScpB [Actinobacteria bacterium]|nr:SMC-Scp complex subunit ScpB [Actinomycetota bacterium]